MTDSLLPTNRFTEGEFRVGPVLKRSLSIFLRNLPPFCLVTAVASLPYLLIWSSGVGLQYLGWGLWLILMPLSEAVLLYAAFDDMRGRRVNMVESVRVGLRRFLPIVGVALGVPILSTFAGILFIVPGLMLYVRWFVAVPACIVEQFGALDSMRRSADLTKGHRWKIFGLLLATAVPDAVASNWLDPSDGNLTSVVVLRLAWETVWNAFGAITVVVAYHDLRVAKEGVDIDEIAAVFD
jgi:hypothetical protein